MILTLFIVFVCSIILVWMGIIGHYFGFALMASSLGAIIWVQVRNIQLRRSIKADTRERKAKWGGELTVISGLSSVTGTACRLFITRYDELIVVDPISERIIPLDEIERMVLLYGKTLESMNDVQIGESAGFQSVPRLFHVRAWIARNPRSRKRLFLAIRFRKPLTVAEYTEMAVFSDIRQSGNLVAFSLRPEIAVRTAVLPRKMNKGKRRRHDTHARFWKGQREYRDEPRRQIHGSRHNDMGVSGSQRHAVQPSIFEEDDYNVKLPSFISRRESFRLNKEHVTEPFVFSSERSRSMSDQKTPVTSDGRRNINEKGLESAIRARRESKREIPSSDHTVPFQNNADTRESIEKIEKREVVIDE